MDHDSGGQRVRGNPAVHPWPVRHVARSRGAARRTYRLRQGGGLEKIVPPVLPTAAVGVLPELIPDPATRRQEPPATAMT